MAITFPIIFIYLTKQLGLIELVKEKMTHRQQSRGLGDQTLCITKAAQEWEL